MVVQSSKVTGAKPSFATIAAMAPPSRQGPTIVGAENDRPAKSSSPCPTHRNKPIVVDSPSASQLHRELQGSISRLEIKDSLPASNTLNEQAKTNIKRAGLRLDDDQTHVSSSSTKAASLDGKSTTSGTTFALDEKESLRPDDSASVQAAEDDDLGSGPTSGAPNSRVGSEAGSRAFRDQFYEISENIPTAAHRSHPLSRRVIAGIQEEGPQTTHPPLVSALPAPIQLARPDIPPVLGPTIEYQYQEPDDKLFEALDSPKDRLFLLRLEQEIITFVKDSTEPKIDLPPCNSFCRLLAHKLADYYALTHFVDNAVSSVTLYRTPYCRIPTPLSALAKAHGPIPTAVAASVVQPAMKIMRRPGMNKDSLTPNSAAGTAESSIVPSKAGSETGEESQQGTGAISPTDSNVAKDKAALTRAEREARYKEKREELFGPQTDNVDGTEAVNEVSRSSSRNEKKKRKTPKNNDDGFEARSQFNAYYPTIPYTMNSYDHAASSATYVNPYAMHSGTANPVMQSGFIGAGMLPQGFQHNYSSMNTAQGFPAPLTSQSLMSGFNAQNGLQAYEQHTPTQYYSVMQQGVAIGQQSPSMSSVATAPNTQMSRPQSQMSDQQWPHAGYTYPYAQTRDQQQLLPAMAPPVPYQYGQLPMQQGGKVQHPLPGSFNRQQTFNPQTRAFVPNGSALPSYGNGHSFPTTTRGSALAFANGTPMSYGQNGPGYPQMPSSNNHNSTADSKSHNNRKSSSQTTSHHSSGPHSPAPSSLSKWGTPANLPPKPPPLEAPSIPEAQHSLPTNNQFNINVQPLSAGQPMPSYQNGVYSMPSAGAQ